MEGATYRLRLFDPSGRLLFERGELARGEVAIPDHVARSLRPEGRYVWTVEVEGLPDAAAVRGYATFRISSRDRDVPE